MGSTAEVEIPLPLHLVILLTVIYFGEKALNRGPGADSDALLAGSVGNNVHIGGLIGN